MPDTVPSRSGNLLRWVSILAAAALVALAVVSILSWTSAARPVPVTGLVRFNGSPLASGVVNFRPVDPQRGSYAAGLIGKDGRYAAETPLTGPGILPGEYQVAVLAQEDPARYTAEEYDALVGPGKPGIPSVVPKALTDPATSGLSVTIRSPGPQTFDLNLEGEQERSNQPSE